MIYLAAFLFTLIVFGGGAWCVCAWCEALMDIEGEL